MRYLTFPRRRVFNRIRDESEAIGVHRLLREAIRGIALILLTGVLAPEVAAQSQPQQGQASPEKTVYVTRKGKKYHTTGCRYLKGSQIPMKLQDAVIAGYTPCGVCHPPTLKGGGHSTYIKSGKNAHKRRRR